MKTALLCLLFASSLLAADGPKTIVITVDYLKTDPTTANELINGAQSPKSGKEWRDALLKLQNPPKCEVLASATVTTKSGQRASAESVQEHIYATEFDPAKGRKPHAPPVPATASGVDVPTPTAFEMKPAGLRFEVDPVVGPDGKLIDLNLAPELVRYFGEEPTLKLPTEGGERDVMTKPRFYSMKIQTSVTVSDGGSALLGTLLPPGEDGNADGTKRVLVFVSVKLVDA
jgi:Flp pilus assembly secretin CpaC